jgi:hypothetical protein
MMIQYLVVGLIILAAVVYGAVAVKRKLSAFRPKQGCATDCGCGTSKIATKTAA